VCCALRADAAFQAGLIWWTVGGFYGKVPGNRSEGIAMENKSMPSPKSGKWKVLLVWTILLGNIIFWTIGSLWWFKPQHTEADTVPGVASLIFLTIIGVFFLCLGVAGYLAVIFTTGFTFDFTRPIWDAVKIRVYFANLAVPLAFGLGIGFILGAFLTPVMKAHGFSGTVSEMGPVLGCICALQVVQMWVLIWAPMEKRLIEKRLMAQGILSEQLRTGEYIGLSTPGQATMKRWFSIEEDIGMLWFGPHQLVYWGDRERFGVTREHLVRVERKLDAKSTTALSGTAHVILHIQLSDGSVRQVRLHTEGVLTMGGKRKAMDQLNEMIEGWRASACPTNA
jgi:hypothetical protein